MVLDRAGDRSFEVPLILLAEALRTGNRRAAAVQIERIGQDELFGFLAPVLRAWNAVGRRGADPLELLKPAESNAVMAEYLAEQRALIQLATGRSGAAEALARVAAESGHRAARLRIAGAALLARRGDRREALALLQGEGETLAAARRLIEGRRRLPGAIHDPATGIAEFLTRLSIDLNSQGARPLAITFARAATFAAPDNPEAWLVAGELLAAQGRHGAALSAAGNIAADDPFAASARDLRVRALLATDRRDAAIAEARAAAEGASAGLADWRRLGDLYLESQRYAEAAAAYGRAIELAGEGNSETPLWALWLTRGAALDRAGDWPEALAALRRAQQLAPQEPLVLNDLGYAQLARRENIEEATRLVAEAHRLAPDSASITDSLGWAYYLQGDYPRAIELLERAAEGEPANTEINEHLGDAYFRAGRRIDARFAWKAALVYAEGEDAERLRAKIETGLTPQLAAR